MSALLDLPATPDPLAALDDRALVAKAQRGSLPAFNALVRRHERAVYNVALRLVGRTGAAEEVTQDTFLRAHAALAAFRGDFRPWVVRIATNRAYDELRRSRWRNWSSSPRHPGRPWRDTRTRPRMSNDSSSPRRCRPPSPACRSTSGSWSC